jgi:MFS family permease
MQSLYSKRYTDFEDQVVGPVAGGFLATAKGWRWVFWVLAMPLGALTIISFPIWRESYPPVLLNRKAALLRKETGNPNLRSKYDTGLSPRAYFKRGIGRAMKMLVYSPIVLCLSIYNGLSYSYFYLLITTLTPVFEETYHFAPDIVGLSYLGVGVGFMIGVTVFARGSDKIVTSLTRKHQGERKPEYRLPLCMIGANMLPVALFWYGWTAQAKAPWIVPILGTGFLGCGNALLFVRNTPPPFLVPKILIPTNADLNPSLQHRRLHHLRRVSARSQHRRPLRHGLRATARRAKDV